MFCLGAYGIDRALPATPGFEGCGDVVDAGPGWLGGRLRGRRIACGGQAGDGLWAEYAVLPATSCLPLPGSLTDEQGACALVNPLTAWALLQAIRRAKPRAVIQTAAAGQLGRMLIRLCRRHGIPLINVVHRPALAAVLRGLGEEHVLDSSAPDFDGALREATHQLGATYALDAVAGEMTGRLLAAMPSGTVVVYGALSGQPCLAGPYDLIFRDKRVEGFWLSEWLRRQNTLLLLLRLRAVLPLLAGDLSSEIAARIPFAEAPARLPDLLKTTSGGKTLLIPR
jgi:NADPH:quinone reductase-like Zn-dependent oxidoreductase